MDRISNLYRVGLLDGVGAEYRKRRGKTLQNTPVAVLATLCRCRFSPFLGIHFDSKKVKGKAVPLQAWSGSECSRKSRFPYFMITAQDGRKVVSLNTGRLYPQGNTPGTHFCWRLNRPQSHSATGWIMSLKNSNDTIGNRTRVA